MNRGLPALLLLLAGCPHRPPPAPEGSLVIAPKPAPAAPEGTPVAPGTWTDASGLSLQIPEGWSGQTGPPGSSLLLTLKHADTGVQVELWSFASSGEVGPRPRPGCEWMFNDAANHRLVPALTPAVTATCLSDDPLAPVVQGWYGRVHGREVQVEVIYPAGRVIEGRAVVEPLLESLKGG